METPEEAPQPEENGDGEGTDPPEPTHEATTPPGSGTTDDEAVESAERNLEQL